MVIGMNELKMKMANCDSAVKSVGQTPIKQIFISGYSAKQVDDICACLEFLSHGQSGALNKNEVKAHIRKILGLTKCLIPKILVGLRIICSVLLDEQDEGINLIV